LRVAVALDDLGRDGVSLEPQPRAGDVFDLGGNVRVRSNRAGNLAHAHLLRCEEETLAIATQLIQPAGELEPKGGRLGVDAVGPPDHNRPTMGERQVLDLGQQLVDVADENLGGLAHLECQGGIDDVRRGQSKVHVASFIAKLLGDRAEKRGHVVLGLSFDLPHSLEVVPGGADRRHGAGRDSSDEVPSLADGQLDGEPGLESMLDRPHTRHVGQTIAI